MTSLANQIHQLLQIGTSRAGGAMLSGGAAWSGCAAPLHAPLQAMPARSDEERLWLTLGALDLWQRAGHAPAPAAGQADAPCEAETLRACPAPAARMLDLLLRDVQPGLPLRTEWLQLAARHGCRIPAAQLPALLALATRQHALRGPALAVLGARGRWLAQRNPDWRWVDDSSVAAGRAADAAGAAGIAGAGATFDGDAAAGGGSAADATSGAGTAAAGTAAGDGCAGSGGRATGIAANELWHTGDTAQRAALLKTWRQADPTAALAALQAEWATEPPESRAALLSCLAVRLGEGDAPFLEAALDDKRKEVRVQAQALLAALPASPLAQRMQARVAALLRREPHVFSADRLRITLPEACDKAMQRDGAGAQQHPGLGEKAGWLADIVGATPLAYWHTAVGDPEDCVKLAGATEFELALMRGWALAVRRQGALAPESDNTHAWLGALLRRWLRGDYGLRQHYPRDFFHLLALLPAPRAHALLVSLAGLPRSPMDPAQVLALLELLEMAAGGMAPDTWPLALSESVLAHLRASLPALARQAWTVKAALPALALVLDPRVADGATASGGWPEHDPSWPTWADSIARLLETLRFRRQMTLSFEEQTS